MILIQENYYNRNVNKAGMQSSNKTGLVLKISVVLFILLALVVYKLNDYFKSEKLYATEAQLHNKVVLVKTTVSTQLQQLKNTLSSYETELADSKINWVQLDPFFAIAKLEAVGGNLKVSQLLVRSNTPSERWNPAYLEKALTINKSLKNSAILTQLFQDKTGAKFIILRFKTSQNKELAVAGSADYFQKLFDIERGESSTALLVTTENILAAHSEGDYIATQTQEPGFSKKKYLLEKQEIVGTNLIAMNYILKKKIAAGFVVPWSIIGMVAGFGCILIAILFYTLDPMERKVERYKKQERAQIYKDTVGDLVNKTAQKNSPLPQTAVRAVVPQEKPVMAATAVAEKKQIPAKDFYAINPATEAENRKSTLEENEEVTKTVAYENRFNEEKTSPGKSPQFLAFQDGQIDISDIEKALALDDFDNEDTATLNPSAQMLKKNLTSQKVSLSAIGAPIDKPRFAIQRKDFNVNEFKVNIRRPEKS